VEEPTKGIFLVSSDIGLLCGFLMLQNARSESKLPGSRREGQEQRRLTRIRTLFHHRHGGFPDLTVSGQTDVTQLALSLCFIVD
jgi:hypothetical protein